MGEFIKIDELNLLTPGASRTKLSHRLLREKIRILESFVYQLDAVIFVHDLHSNRHIWTNGRYEQLIGYTWEDIGRMSTDEALSLFHIEDLSLLLEEANLLRHGQSSSFTGIYRIRHKSGHWVWMYGQASIIQRDRLGRPAFALGIAVDFSPHIQAENHLSDMINENRRLTNHIRLNCLTRREKEIIVHLTEGLTCKEISRVLGISYLTAETHIKNIHRKLGISNVSALLRFAAESGLR